MQNPMRFKKNNNLKFLHLFVPDLLKLYVEYISEIVFKSRNFLKWL